MREISFVKMHGLENDFVIIDGRKENLSDYSRLAKKICDRRKGIGCDQLLILSKSKRADVYLTIFNNDGSEAQMCGNGIRCVASFLMGNDANPKKDMLIETLSGIKEATIFSKRDVEINMGKPIFEPSKIPVNSNGEIINKNHKFNNMEYNISCVSLGNPHCVIVGEDSLLESITVSGPVIENDPLFPERTNVEFVSVLDKGNLKVRLWERGAGETKACGSGAVAVMVVCKRIGLVEDSVNVNMPGGALSVKWDGEGYTYLRGPVSFVFRGTFDIGNFKV